MIPSLQDLIKSNPSLEWLEERFAAKIMLLRGDVIQVTFDTQLDVEKQTFLTDKDVFNNWGEILKANEEEDNSYRMEEICEDLAELFSERIAIITRSVRWQVATASVILVYLASGFYVEAAASAQHLCDDIISLDETRGNQIWGKWLDNVRILVTEHIETECDENTSDRY
jgi:hypothetical protein